MCTTTDPKPQGQWQRQNSNYQCAQFSAHPGPHLWETHGLSTVYLRLHSKLPSVSKHKIGLKSFLKLIQEIVIIVDHNIED